MLKLLRQGENKMKFKLVQFATLLIFVMSVVYMGQVPNVFAGEVSTHPPEFYVDDKGTNQGGNATGPNGQKYKDPRIHSKYKDSDGNGTDSASSWLVQYEASGLINGGHKEGRDNAAEQVYGVRVDLSASAGNSSCSASSIPSLTDDVGLTADNPGWSGHGRVILTINQNKNAHMRKLFLFKKYCIRINVKRSSA